MQKKLETNIQKELNKYLKMLTRNLTRGTHINLNVIELNFVEYRSLD